MKHLAINRIAQALLYWKPQHRSKLFFSAISQIKKREAEASRFQIELITYL